LSKQDVERDASFCLAIVLRGSLDKVLQIRKTLRDDKDISYVAEVLTTERVQLVQTSRPPREAIER
jgi:hypothetical protein